ncbi:uncharacterized protein METZ01_LOCUS2222 [marine metagenome]|uniref:Uncharacterized protein n=1 Tax=marine metagenome TaxID=408172 RepID=A0A381N6U5_9ZZZZ
MIRSETTISKVSSQMPSRFASIDSGCLDERVIKSGALPCTRQPGVDTQGASYFVGIRPRSSDLSNEVFLRMRFTRFSPIQHHPMSALQ